MITYNHGAFIADALMSVMTQDYPAVEVVVADDGSTDGTYDIAREFADRYPGRVHVLPQSVNRGIDGIVDNANRALRACRGEFVAFLEGDDVFLPDKVAQQVRWLTDHEQAALCGHDVEIFDSVSGQRLGLCSDRRPLRTGLGPRDLVRHGVPYCTASIMVRRHCLPPGGFDTRLRMVLDWKMWIDVVTPDREYGFIPGVFARYRRHASGVTSQSDKARGVHSISFTDLLVTVAGVEAMNSSMVRDCDYARGRLFCAEGLWHLERGDVSAGRAYLWRALRCANLIVRAKAPIWLVLSLLPTSMFGRIVHGRSNVRKSVA